MPIHLTFSILLTTTAGLVVFGEWNEFGGSTSIILFALGIMTIMGGAIALTQSPESQIDPTSFADRSISLEMEPACQLQNDTEKIQSSDVIVPPVLLSVPIPSTYSIAMSSSEFGSSSDFGTVSSVECPKLQ